MIMSHDFEKLKFYLDTATILDEIACVVLRVFIVKFKMYMYLTMKHIVSYTCAKNSCWKTQTHYRPKSIPRLLLINTLLGN